ncbi:MAG: hypothetical protein LBG16_05450 [Elusimicrobiota bacterium]|jgi:hypothetical protein|nr:hypothetical protein [Elusimicrobiota bacterium]
MKLEIRKITISSLFLSAYPLVLFGLALARALLAPPDFSASATAVEMIMQVVLGILVETAVMLVLSVVIAFVYNLFCSFGIKGIRFDIEEVEEAPGPQGD